jgi:Fe-S cluster assembly ATP-binding protein
MEQDGHLVVKDLSLTLGGKQILRHVSIDFWPGHVHALIGPNGAGKSTLASAIMGLGDYRGFEGDIILDGRSLKQEPVDERARRGITLAWQEPARYEGLPVRVFVRAGAREKSLDTVRRSLERVGLDPALYANRAVDKTLSGGERKRIELASILAMEPRIVMMDEPDSGIDVDALNRIFRAIADLKQRGTTVILITHSLTVLRNAEHAFLFCCGKLVEKGSVDKIANYFENQCIPCDHRDAWELPNVLTGA